MKSRIFLVIAILKFGIFLTGCEIESRANYRRMESVEESIPCSQLIQMCRERGFRGYEIWRSCIEPYAKSGRELSGIEISRQAAMTCSDLRKALYGRRYWFNGLEFR